jgi:Mn-dependent DtxR family transcriptional regulator
MFKRFMRLFKRREKTLEEKDFDAIMEHRGYVSAAVSAIGSNVFMTHGELASALNVSAGELTGMVSYLSAAHLIRYSDRTPVRYYSLTVKGERMLRSAAR